MSSRFFTEPTPAVMGNILVPNSSPLSSSIGMSSYQPYSSQAHVYDVAPATTNSWANQYKSFGNDPLSAPSAFYSNGTTAVRRQREPSDEQGPPAKRLQRDPLPQATSVTQTSPDSPDIIRAGARRRLPSSNADESMSTSSEELPDVSSLVEGPSKSRITRGRQSPPASSSVAPTPPQASDELVKFNRFSMTMPTESPVRVKAAWLQAGQDVKKATALLSDPSWSPQRPKEVTGRVDEVLEASKAQRAREREKGKNSLIYASRPQLPVNTQPTSSRIATPPVSKSAIDLTINSSPAPAPRKRIRKMRVDSDSELELSDSDNDRPKRPRHGNPNGIRALDYFNTKGPEALQELTGMRALPPHRKF